MDTIRLPDSVQSQQPPSQTKQRTKAEKKDYNPEVWHIKFRGFSPSERSDPVEDLKRISELCFEWLRPDLNSKEQILDQLVLEQFMICMPPELQALAKESRVKSCRELEKMLRERGAPRQWSIIHSQGQLCLLRDATVELPEASKDKWDGVALFQKHLNRGQASPELQNLSQTEEPSTGQKEEVCLERDPDIRDQDYPIPGNDKVSVSTPQSPQLIHSPDADALRGTDVTMMPQDDTNMDVVIQFTHIQESGDFAEKIDHRSLCISKGDNVSACPGEPPCMDNTEDGRLVADTLQPVELASHLTGKAPFVCSECKKTFLYESQYIIHKRTHTGERPFGCSVCKKGFLQSSDLHVHQRIHTGEKPYVCEICSKAFTHKSTLRGHIRTHTKEKLYQCEHCGKCVSHKGSLNVHLRIHRDLRPYKCKECNMAFRQLGALNRHAKVHR